MAIWARLLLDRVLGEVAFPYPTLFFAILVTAWYGGVRPALVAVVLGALSSDFFLIAPRGHFSIPGSGGYVGMALFLSVGAGIALLGGAMHAARQTSEGAASDTWRRQAALIDQVHDAVLALGLDGRDHLLEQRRGKTLRVFSRRSITGKAGATICCKPPRRFGVDGFLSILERDGSWEGELEHVTQDGRHIIVETRMVLVHAGR